MPGKQALHKQAAGFIDTMDCLPVSRLPEGPEWTYEIKAVYIPSAIASIFTMPEALD